MFERLPHPVIAIDGTVGSGKSTVARLLADRLGFLHIDTGAMYRAVAWAARQRGLNLHDPEAVGTLAGQVTIRLERGGDGLRVWCDNTDVTHEIRTPQVSRDVSVVAFHEPVRLALVPQQRRLGLAQPAVMEGRDIGTVVFPDATHKFFLDADLDERAHRRWLELQHHGIYLDLDLVRREVAERDERDRTRPVGALRRADDAILVNTSGMSIEEVVDALAQRITLVQS